ncbi:MAG: phosphomannomutase/phosphoglucomutase [Alphaproteobacteria bacterium]
MTVHVFDPSILREYDIRGLVGETLTAADAHAIGHAFATVLARDGDGGGDGGSRPVHVGRDGRTSSAELEDAVVAGLKAGGMDVVRIGMGATPMLYYAVFSRPSRGGVMVTGSHNPPQYNGFKLVAGNKPFFGEDITQLGALAAAGDYTTGAGAEAEVDVFEAYVSRLVEDFTGAGGQDLTIAWDSGNGSAGPAMAALTERLPGRHFLLNDNVDGSFPAHHPDPTVVENLVQLQDTVRAESCDLGIAFDGDGDRIGVVDGQGRILWGDQLMALWSREVLSQDPGATIIADVKASQVLFDEIARLGGKPLMWRTGHSLIKAKMAETGAPLAGEMSGHIFFADRYYGYDDALYAAVRLLNVIAGSGSSLAQLRDQLPEVVNTPELRFPCADERKFAVVDEVKARLRDDGAEINDCDGVRVTGADGWWLLRASNTQDVLVARLEAQSAEGLKRLQQELVRELEASGVVPPQF